MEIYNELVVYLRFVLIYISIFFNRLTISMAV